MSGYGRVGVSIEYQILEFCKENNRKLKQLAEKIDKIETEIQRLKKEESRSETGYMADFKKNEK